MTYQNLENEILQRVHYLNGDQRNRVLSYIENIPKTGHNTKLHKRKGLKQIRQALKDFQ